MKMNPFAHDQGILTQEEILFVEETVVETFRFELQARNLFPVRDLGTAGGAQFYRYYTETDPSEAVISNKGKAQGDDYPIKEDNQVDIPIIEKNFLLNWRDIASSRRMGPSIIEDSIRTATRRVAEAEDRLAISGECTTWLAKGIEGLFTATGRGAAAASGNWPANAVADINTGRAWLQAQGFVGIEPILLGPPAMIKCLDAQIANTTSTWRQFLLDNNLISDAIESSNAFAADCGVDSVVLVVPGSGNFYMVQDLPLTTVLWEDKQRNVHGLVREAVAPVIARPTSIYEINTITCA